MRLQWYHRRSQEIFFEIIKNIAKILNIFLRLLRSIFGDIFVWKAIIYITLSKYRFFFLEECRVELYWTHLPAIRKLKVTSLPRFGCLWVFHASASQRSVPRDHYVGSLKEKIAKETDEHTCRCLHEACMEAKLVYFEVDSIHFSSKQERHANVSKIPYEI